MRARRSHKEALQLLEQALAMRRRLFRGSHPAIAGPFVLLQYTSRRPSHDTISPLDCLNAMAEVFRVENKFSQVCQLEVVIRLM